MTGETKKSRHNKFPRHAGILMWKSYLQRIRRWRWWLAETVFASIVYTIAVFIAKPVFLTPLRDQPEPPLTMTDILASLNKENIIGYTPDVEPYKQIMVKAAKMLNMDIAGAPTEMDLNNLLFELAQESAAPLRKPVIWIIWKPTVSNKWSVSIRSTERARYEAGKDTATPNPHLRAGFLAVQVAVSHAILHHHQPDQAINYDLNLVSMPVSPLMQETSVRTALSGILLCFTLSLIPPVLETEALVVSETMSKFKRGLRMRGVGYTSMYSGWLVYAYLTALPISFLAAVTMILIFRWIHLMFALVIVLAYVTVLILMALIMAMFHSKAWISCVWSTLFTLMQTYLAELLVYHEYGVTHGMFAMFLQIFMPPLGLVHAFNQFALLETGRGGVMDVAGYSVLFAIVSWSMIILIYFSVLMLLQRIIGQERAIGGQVSWKSIIFKKAEDVNKLRYIEPPTVNERQKLQEVKETLAKAISFRNVSKSIMGVPVLSNVTMDIYRGEFSMLFAERVQERMIVTLDDLLTGLTLPDKGTIYVLGEKMVAGRSFLSEPHMIGYCHRANILVPDLTVEEHLTLYTEICLWYETKQYLTEFKQIRCRRLLEECNLLEVQHVQVRELGSYYCAQLCWGLAALLEPRIIVVPNFTDQKRTYVKVIKDKIMAYKKYLTIIKLCFSTVQLEHGDRVFVFDTKVLAFGGTPSYMFFKYGREYRVRITVSGAAAALLARAAAGGAAVRAHLGRLLILRVPARAAAALLAALHTHRHRYGITSLHLSVPDSEEVYRRVIYESRAIIYHTTIAHPNEVSKDAMKRFAEPVPWKRNVSWFGEFTHLRDIAWKFISFHIHYRLYFIITMLATFSTGVFIGLSLSSMLRQTDHDNNAKKLLHGELLTMENLDQRTNLVLRSDYSLNATAMAHAYILSEPGATQKSIDHITYTALSHTESLTEYLVTRAIDSPQQYVFLYAYGMDVRMKNANTLLVNALYSPLHYDYGAAARSLAKVYTTLLRHYTDSFNSTIQVTDDPLALDLTPWMGFAMKPPLLILFLLIVSTVHFTLIPSMEHGLIRHMQSHAMNFSPAQYWFTLFFCDLVLYWFQVAIISGVMTLMMYLVAPADHFKYGDLLIVPFILIIYGFACIPQAYLISLGPRVTLNAMTFAIVNIVFAETTTLTKILKGKWLDAALFMMRISPQFNLAYGFTKMKTVFLYNSECVIFRSQDLCTGKAFHKCCKKCGILQTCFVRRKYLKDKRGIRAEMVSLCVVSALYMSILLMLEYKVFQRLGRMILAIFTSSERATDILPPGASREKYDVLDKVQQIKSKRKNNVTVDTFGESLIAENLTRKEFGEYAVRNVYLGLGKGDALALCGIKRHGRVTLMEMLAGYKLPCHGEAWCMSKRRLTSSPHNYCRQISLSCELDPMPPWLSVRDGLRLLALLRGVPRPHVDAELETIMDALDMRALSDTAICRIKLRTERTRVHFAAAVVGAPAVVLADECTAYQKFSVRRAMYAVLHALRARGHAVLVSSASVESHMPLTNRLAILVDGTIYDVDTVDALGSRYGVKGYTIVIHVIDTVDVQKLFASTFEQFTINDVSETMANVQVPDDDHNWATIFQRMENLKLNNPAVDAYVVTATPIDRVYNSIIHHEEGNKLATDFISRCCYSKTPRRKPSRHAMEELVPFEVRYRITQLTELPWSVIFQTQYNEREPQIIT